jgi:hypothetical protein
MQGAGCTGKEVMRKMKWAIGLLGLLGLLSWETVQGAVEKINLVPLFGLYRLPCALYHAPFSYFIL